MKEKLQEYALIAEIVGGVAIVISLVFVGLEIRHNNAISRTEAYQRNLDALNEWRALVLTTGNAEAVLNFLSSGTIEEGKEAEIQVLQSVALMVFDRAYFSYKNGIMDEAGWNRFYSILCPIWENQFKITNNINFVSQDFREFSSNVCGFKKEG